MFDFVLIDLLCGGVGVVLVDCLLCVYLCYICLCELEVLCDVLFVELIVWLDLKFLDIVVMVLDIVVYVLLLLVVFGEVGCY